MRIAVISDMHGNNLAFEGVLADIKQQGTDQIVCLGDAIQGGPQPAEVVRNLRALNCPVVMGNADAWLLTGEETGDEGIPEERLKKMEWIRQWSLSQLSEDDKAFIANFQPTVTIPLGGSLDLLCFHGSPTSFDDVILPHSPKEVFEQYLGAYSDKILKADTPTRNRSVATAICSSSTLAVSALRSVTISPMEHSRQITGQIMRS